MGDYRDAPECTLTTPSDFAETVVVPPILRWRLRWDGRHERAAAEIMQKFKLKLPRDRELIRQLAVVRVAQGHLDWLD